MLSQEKENTRQEEFLKYQIEEIRKADLKENEDEELEKARHIIASSEKLKQYSSQIYQAIYENQSSNSQEDSTALTKLNQAAQALRKLVDLDPSLNQQLESLDKSIFSLEEIAREVHRYNENLDFDPARLAEIEERLELIRGLKRKYGKTIADIQEYYFQTTGALKSIETFSERQMRLQEQKEGLKRDIVATSTELSYLRHQAARELEVDVKRELQDLDMGQMQFAVALSYTPSSEGISAPDGTVVAFNSSGFDNIEFVASTNPGEPLRPLSKIASTGEISRFTLALKGALSEADSIPVLIFDEVDIGIGGRGGDIIGKKLWALARHHQVICVTHLPQIAAYASAHFGVQKKLLGERTTSTLEKLTGDSRLSEMALMLAGPGYSETALKNAAELMQKAANWKNDLPGTTGP